MRITYGMAIVAEGKMLFMKQVLFDWVVLCD